MVDASSIASAVGGLKATGDILKGLFDLSTNAKMLGKLNELQRLIYDAQGNALTAQGEQAALIARIAELEKEIVRLKEWGAERENYHLSEIGRGATAYVAKPGVKPAETPHWLCTHCYNDHRKSILQPQGHIEGERTWQCPACKATLKVAYSDSPKDHAAHETWKRLGPGEECPRCHERSLRTESITDHPVSAMQQLGAKIHHMKCSHCDMEFDKDVD